MQDGLGDPLFYSFFKFFFAEPSRAKQSLSGQGWGAEPALETQKTKKTLMQDGWGNPLLYSFFSFLVSRASQGHAEPLWLGLETLCFIVVSVFLVF